MPAKSSNGPKCSIKNPPQLLKEMTSSAAFRCVQAWLLEKPTAWADDPCLAAAQMAQRPPAKRPCEDALLEAERSHQRRRIELLDKQLDGALVEVRRLARELENTEKRCARSARLFAPRPRSGLSLPWTSRGTGGGKIGKSEMTRARRAAVKELISEWQAELSETDYPVYLFAPGYLVDPVGATAFDRLNPDPNHIPDLDFRAGHLALGPAPDVAQSNLCHFGVRVGEVRRHLRGSVLPSVDLAQDVGQHEVPLPPPARSGRYATQHGLLDGADDALTCFSMSQKSSSSLNSPLNSEPSSEYTLAGTPRAWNTFFMPAAVVLARRSLVSASMATSMKGYGLPPKAFIYTRCP